MLLSVVEGTRTVVSKLEEGGIRFCSMPAFLLHEYTPRKITAKVTANKNDRV